MKHVLQKEVADFGMQGTDAETIFRPKCVMFSAHEGDIFKEYMTNQGVDRFIDKLPSKDQIFNLVVDAIKEVKNKLNEV